MGRPYTQLSMTEREQIEMELRRGASWAQIGRLLNRPASAAWREVRRNTGAGEIYRGRRADEQACKRRHKPRRARKLACAAQRDYVHRRLRVGWSPQHIAGRGPLVVSISTIYREAYAAQQDVWPQLLRGVRRSETRRKLGHERIRGRVMIDQRPAVVEQRARIGDWEGDTIRSPDGSAACVLTLVERRTRLVRIALLADRSAATLNAAAAGLLRGYAVHSLTVDNGMEFAGHPQLARLIGAPVFFCHAHHPEERGSNEQTNGLLRHYLARGTDLAGYSEAYLRRVERLLNRRPRVCLNFLSPEEAMVASPPLHLK